jgi:hypothetical protein
MNNEIKEIIEEAAERYVEDVCREVERNVFLTPPERESYKKLISNGYFCGAYELWKVLTETINEKTN